MQWWAWIAVGAILLGSEMTFVNAQFYLVFIGSAALVVGLMDLAGLRAADWLQWTIFAPLAAVSMVGFRRRVYERMRGHLPAVNAGPEGREVVIMPTVLRARRDLPARISRQLLERGQGGPIGDRCRARARASSAWTDSRSSCTRAE